MLDTHLGYSEPTLVATKSGGQAGMSYPLAPVYDASQLKYVRASVWLKCLSGGTDSLDVEICIELSEDGVSWPTSTTTPVSFSAVVVRSSEGISGPSGALFEDISSLLTKRYVRFTFWVKNHTGVTATSTCLASMRIERKSC